MPGLPYRGTDRRRGAAHDLPAFALGLAVGTLGLLLLVFAALAAAGVKLPADRADRIDDVARMVTPVGAGAVCAACVMRWRLAGVATVLWLAGAVFVLGVVVVGVAGVVLPITLADTGHTSWVGAARAAGLIVTTVMLVLALVMPPVDARVRPGKLAAGVVGAVITLTLVFAALPGAGDLIAYGHRVSGRSFEPSSRQWALVAVVWAVASAPFLLAGVRQRYPLFVGAGLMLVAFALGAAAAAVADGPRDIWVLGQQAFRAAGLIFLLVACVVDLESVFADQRVRLFDTEVAIAAVQTHRRVGMAGASRQRHDVRSALMAVEGAAMTLERHFDQLKPTDREHLTELLGAGVDRLKRLIDLEGASSPRLDVKDAVLPVASQLGAAGVLYRVDLPDGLAASGWGADATEVIKQVVSVARQNAGFDSVVFSGAPTDDSIVLLVSRSFLSTDRTAIDRMLTEAQPPWELGLGLHVAARLLGEQGGELSVAADSDQNPVFLLRLPAVPADARRLD